jgi:hypothetical protein
VIAATTMLAPEAVGSLNAYRAMRAVLRVAAMNPERVRSIYCPGLCTGVGMVPAAEAAQAMAEGYKGLAGEPPSVTARQDSTLQASPAIATHWRGPEDAPVSVHAYAHARLGKAATKED